MLEMKVKTVALIKDGSFSVLLADKEEKNFLPIMVGPFEAQAIALPLQGKAVPRPMTHDLLRSVCDNLDAVVEKVVICDINDGTFYAELYLKQGDKEIVIDSRPSDGIALALRCEAPIYMGPHLIEFTYDSEDIVFSERPDEI